MKTLNRKTVLAAAIASVLSGPAMAAEIIAPAPADALTYSAQGAGAATARIDWDIDGDIDRIAVELGRDYTVNDELRFTFTGATINPNSTPVLVSFLNEAAHTADTNGIAGDGAGVGDAEGAGSIGFLTLEGTNTVVFRYISFAPGEQTTGNVLQLNGINLENIGEEVTVSFASRVDADTALESAPAVEIINTDDQFSLVAGGDFDGTISVAQDRLQFVDDPDAPSYKSIVGPVTLAPVNETTLLNPVTLETIEHVLTGDFSFVDLDTLTLADYFVNTPVAAGEADTFAFSINGDLTQLTISQTCNEACDDASIEIDVSGGVVAPDNVSALLLQDQTILADVSFVYEDPEDATASLEFAGLTGAEVGVWDLDGSSVYVPYMPYGPNISQIIYLSNAGVQTGRITARAFFEDVDGDIVNSCNLGDIGQARAGEITKLTGPIQIALASCTGFGATGKVAMYIESEVKAEDVEVYSAYNVNGSDRGLVINSSNK